MQFEFKVVAIRVSASFCIWYLHNFTATAGYLLPLNGFNMFSVFFDWTGGWTTQFDSLMSRFPSLLAQLNCRWHFSSTCFHSLPIDLMQDLATKLGLKETVRRLNHLVEKCLDSWGVQWSHGEAFWYCMDLLIHWIAFTVVMFNLWWIRVCSSIGRSHKTLKSQILASSFLQKKSCLWALYILEVDVSIWLSVFSYNFAALGIQSSLFPSVTTY